MTEWNNVCSWFPTKGGLLACKNWVSVISHPLEEETAKAGTASGVGTSATSATVPSPATVTFSSQTWISKTAVPGGGVN